MNMHMPNVPPAPNDEVCRGADTVINSLIHQQVEVVFGMIGGVIMPVYDALYRQGGIRHIMVGHEQGAAHMADGYARATGKPGVVITTSGPGATNLVTGLATAMMDSVPMVAITGQVSTDLLGNDAFQEADMWGITMPVTKHNYQAASAEELPDIFAEAFFLAMSGRPGPVLIDLPKDVSLQECSPDYSVPKTPEGYNTPYHADKKGMDQALELLRVAEQPVILAGGGVILGDASKELVSLAEDLGTPVTTTLMGLGAIPGGHPLFLGMPGMHGTGYANLALHHSDVILCVGARLDDRVTGDTALFAPRAKLIHIDVDPSEINKILPSTVPLAGHAKPVLSALRQGVRSWQTHPGYKPWLERIEEWKAEYPMVYAKPEGVLMPQQAVEALGRHLDDEAVVVTGVGQHQMFAAQYYPVQRPRGFITSGGLGTMGFGLPAALGAKLARPQSTVVCLDGDGSFLMNIQELATAVRYRIGVVTVVLNNTNLGMVRQWQDMFLDGRRSETELQCPPYDQVAQAFGGLGRAVSEPDGLEPALEWALEQSRRRSLPVVLNVHVCPDALVLPMVPPGGANPDFIPCSEEE